MIWATVNSRSYFCWLCRTSPSLATKNIINLISVLTMWWCPCIFWFVGKQHLLWPVCSLDKTVSLCPAPFCTPRPNLPVVQLFLDFLLLHSNPLCIYVDKCKILYWFFCHYILSFSNFLYGIGTLFNIL